MGSGTPANALCESYRLTDSAERRVIVYDNGLTAILQRHAAMPIAAVRVYVRGGSTLEGPLAGSGVSHLLEHVITGDGTLRHSAEKLLALGDSIGGLVNAYTCCDHICHHVTTAREHLKTAVEMFADYVTCPRLSQAVFDRELGVVQRELERDRDDPHTRLEEMLHEVMYRGHPMRYPVIGLRQGLMRLTPEILIAHYRRTHVPQNVVVVIAGDIDLDQAAGVVAGAFGGWAPQGAGVVEAAWPAGLPEPLPPVCPVRAIRAMETESVSLCMAWMTVREGADDDVPLDLLSSVLAEGDGARLVKTLRWERGLVHEVSAAHESTWHTPGMFSVSAQCDPEHVQAVYASVLELIGGLETAAISEAELQRAKRQTLAGLWYQRETAEGLAGQLGEDFLATGNVDYFQAYVERIERLGADDLVRVARQYLRPSSCVLAAVVPDAEAPARAAVGGKATTSSDGRPSRKTAKKLLQYLEEPRASARAVQQMASHETVSSPQSEGESDGGSVARFALAEGWTCVVRPMAESRFVAVDVCFPGGLLAETPRTNGVFNLMAQCLPRGTKHRNGQQIADAFAARGSALRSRSGLNQFGCGFVVRAEEFQPLLEILAEVIQSPAFDSEQVAKVKPAILDAIARVDEDWHGELIRFARQHFFEFSPYRLWPAGTQETVSSLGAEDLKRTHSRFVCGGRGVLAVAGRVGAAAVREAASRLFGGSGGGREPLIPTVPPEPVRGEDRLFIKESAGDREVAGVFVGFAGLSFSDRGPRAATAVLETMLTGYALPSGRLYSALRGGDRDLVYEVTGASLTGVLPGYIGFAAGCEPGGSNRYAT